MCDMNSPRQRDLFQDDEQAELFNDAPTPVYRPNPDQVRAELQRILTEAKAAQTLPWEPKKDRTLSDDFSADDRLSSGGRGSTVAGRV